MLYSHQMKKLKIFINTYTKTLTDPTYYTDIIQAPFKFSLKYYLFFFFALSIINTTIFSLQTAPKIRSAAQDIVSEITATYPSNLELSLTNGLLDLKGVDTSLTIPFPTQLKSLGQELGYDGVAYVTTEDTQEAAQTIVTLTKDELIIRETDDTKQYFAYNTLYDEDLTIDKNSIQLITSAQMGQFEQIYPYLPIPFFLAIYISSTLITFVIALIFSLFTMLMSQIISKSLSYKKSLQIGLHAITFAETINFAHQNLFSDLNLPSFYGLAFFGVIFLALSKQESTAKKIN